MYKTLKAADDGVVVLVVVMMMKMMVVVVVVMVMVILQSSGKQSAKVEPNCRRRFLSGLVFIGIRQLKNHPNMG